MDQQEGFDIPALKAQLLEHLLGSHADIYPVHLEQNFPRILAKIVALWGTTGLGSFPFRPDGVRPLPGRQGFPPDAGMETFRL